LYGGEKTRIVNRVTAREERRRKKEGRRRKKG
jgi:hypothetical protein